MVLINFDTGNPLVPGDQVYDDSLTHPYTLHLNHNCILHFHILHFHILHFHNNFHNIPVEELEKNMG